MVEENSKVFQTSNRNEAGKIILDPLINEPYTYENMINNPILKPVMEADKSIQDIDEMIAKKLIDSNREKSWINEVIDDVPAYSDSPFVTRLISLSQDTQDVIKLQDLQISSLKKCLREIFELVRQRYGVKIESDSNHADYTEPETKIPGGSYEEYLQTLAKSKDETVKQIGQTILKTFKEDNTTPKEKTRFQNACALCYKNESDKSKKEIVAKIIRMELLERGS